MVVELGESGSSDVEPVCIRFVNTVGWRRGPDRYEHIVTPAGLPKWMEGNGLPTPDEITAQDLERALKFREALYEVLSAIARGDRAPAADLDIVNGEICEAMSRLEIAADLRWRLDENDRFERSLKLLALSAAAVMTGEERGRIRECANHPCGWMFIDRSKNRSRRWCSMSDCGNVAKARRFQARRSKPT